MSSSPSLAELIQESLYLERSGEFGAALRRARKALELANTLGEPLGMSEALLNLARIQFHGGKYHEASHSAQQALSLAPDCSSAQAEAWLRLGACAAEASSLSEAESCYQRCIEIAREAGDHQMRMRALHNLSAGVYLPRGQFDLALAADREALRIAGKSQLQDWVVFPLITIAWNYFLTGQHQNAHQSLEDLMRASQPGSWLEGYYFCLMAHLCEVEGEAGEALSLYERTRSIAEASGEPWLNIEIRLGMSCHHRLAGDGPCALAWAQEARDYAVRSGYLHEQGRALTEHARCAYLCGEPQVAANDLREAIRILSQLGADYDLAYARFIHAALLSQQRSTLDAAAWEEAASAILDGGFAFILDQERFLAYQLITAHHNSTDPKIAGLNSRCIEQLQRVPPPPLRIVTLGTFEVWRGKEQADKRSLHKRRAGELLILLLLKPSHTLWFDQVAETLWFDKSPTAALALFHQSTSALRRLLEPELPEKFHSRYLEVEEGQVTLTLPPGSSVDFSVFEELCISENYQAALEIYKGDFLLAHLYMDWTAAPRERFKRLYLRALLVMAHRTMQSRQEREALDLCYRILEVDPWQEEAVLLGMQACLALKDRTGAIRLYQKLERVLDEELGVAPQDELQALYRQIVKSQA